MNLSKVNIPHILAVPGPLAGHALGLLISALFLATPARAQRPAKAQDSHRQPAVAWIFNAGAAVVSTPVIDSDLVFFGSEDSIWYALELATGKVRWKLPTRAAIRANAAVYGSHVFLAGGNGVLTCADKATGSVVWRTVFDPTAVFMGERSYDFADYYHSSPLIEDGTIYLGTGNGVMNAFDAATGVLRWRFQAGDIIHCRPVTAGDKIVMGCFDGFIYALNKRDGQLAWKFKTIGHQYFPRGEVQGLLATDGERVFAGARDYNFYAIDAATGTAAWNLKFTNGWAMSATVADSVVYVGTSDDRVMVAVDARSGHEYWRTPVNFNIFGGAVAGPELITFGTIWGKVYALDRRRGDIQWTFETEGYRKNHPRYFDSNDRFRSDIGTILRSPFAWVKAEREMGGVFSTPAIAGNVMIVTSSEGKVYALKR